MRDDLIKSISNKFLIQYEYDGGIRIVEPHCFGITSAGHDGLRAYQVDGYSSTGRMGWKMFVCTKITALIILEKNFDSPRPDYKKGDKGMKSIYCEL